MKLFGRDPVKEAKRLNSLLAANKIKMDKEQQALHMAAKAKIEENKTMVAEIEEESLGLFKSIQHLPALPVPQPDQTVNKIFTPDTVQPTLKDNLKVIKGIGKSIFGLGNTILSDSLNKLSKNLK